MSGWGPFGWGSIPRSPTSTEFAFFYEPIEWLIKLIGQDIFIFYGKVQEDFLNDKIFLLQGLQYLF